MTFLYRSSFGCRWINEPLRVPERHATFRLEVFTLRLTTIWALAPSWTSHSPCRPKSREDLRFLSARWVRWFVWTRSLKMAPLEWGLQRSSSDTKLSGTNPLHSRPNLPGSAARFQPHYSGFLQTRDPGFFSLFTLRAFARLLANLFDDECCRRDIFWSAMIWAAATPRRRIPSRAI